MVYLKDPAIKGPKMIQSGMTAPDFELVADNGSAIKLSHFRGRPVVLYFYPKDDTPGCIRQACNFGDVYARLMEKGAVVLGISRDNRESHLAFKHKYKLPFTLLSDSDGAVSELYGVWREKMKDGKTAWGILRSTFVVASSGVVIRATYGTDPERDAENSLEALNTGASGPDEVDSSGSS